MVFRKSATRHYRLWILPGRIRGEGLFISVFRKPDESPGKQKSVHKE